MALVSYGASDDSDLSDEEEEVEKVTASAAVSAVKKATPFESNGHISDEEDEFLGGGIIKTMQHQITDIYVFQAMKIILFLKKKNLMCFH